MYKNLNPAALGISGRQSELIELALTCGFRGLDLDAAELLKRAALQGVPEAARYVLSGKVKVGGWTLPVNLGADKEAFRADLEKLTSLAERARQLGISLCLAPIDPGSDTAAYVENFEWHRERLGQAADILAKSGICLGVAFRAAAECRQGRTFQFIHKAEETLTLIRTTGSSNVVLVLDTWNWSVGGGGVEQLNELSGKQIAAVKIADVPAGADPATIAASERLLPSEDTIPQHAALLKNLAKRGFDGPVSLEPHSSQFSGMSRDAAVEKAAGILERIWAAAGLSKTGKLVPAVEA